MTVLNRLNPGLQRWIKEQGWNGLRAIQEAALDPILEGEDCIIEAPTAGGKTEAVLFPALTRAAGNRRDDSVQVLYIAPLRALLNNLELRGEQYAQCCGLHAFKWHGDVSQNNKVAQLKTPPHLLLTTPESIEAILLRKADWRRFFAGVNTIIIDEAHNFASGDRGGQLLSLMERLEQGTGRRPQRIAVSATVGNPDTMCKWLTGDRHPARRIHVEGTANPKSDFLVRHFDADLDSDDLPIQDRAGMRLLNALCDEVRGRRTITFVRSRHQAENIATAIQSYTKTRPIRVRTHHSAISKFFREEAESLIQEKGEQGLESIISTSTLELGIDIGELDRVLQLGALSSSSAFLQRVGRTGRRAGSARYFHGFTETSEDLLLLAATVSLGEENRSESLRLNQRAFHLLAHQLLCLCLQEHGINKEQAWHLLKRVYVFSRIKYSEYSAMIDHMLDKDYLHLADGVLAPGLATEQRYLTGNWRKLFAVFDSAPLYDVFNGRTQIGTLDTAFVEGLTPPFLFTLAGRLWRADTISYANHTLQARPAPKGEAPKWQSFGGPDIPFETAQRAGELLHRFRDLPDFLDDAARDALEAVRGGAEQRPDWRPLGLECRVHGGGRATLTTYAGDRLNRTLARLLSARGLATTGNYGSVDIKKGPKDLDELERLIEDTLDGLAGADSSTDYSSLLLETQKAWRFSPFAPMLPEALIKAALIDGTTDLEGLRAFLAKARRLS